MPENTQNDAPGADRPTARAGQEGPARAGGGAARPPGEIAAGREAREAVQEAAKRAAAASPAEAGSPTDTAP